jgi:Zn2+/Cd2+-exporting ATPase
MASDIKIRTGKYAINGVDCASCATRIENALNDRAELGDVFLNFAAGTITLDTTDLPTAREIIRDIEPGVDITDSADGIPPAESTSLARGMRIAIFAAAALLFVLGIAFNDQLHSTPGSLAEYAVFLLAYGLVGWRVLYAAARNIVRGRLFNEHFLMTIATIGAFAIHEMPEAVGVMLFYYVGEFFQDMAVDRSRRSIKSLMDIKPEFAFVKSDGEITAVAPELVRVGDTIVVRPGERVPLDGAVIEGSSFLDASALTGESTPQSVVPGSEVLAGMVNTTGLLQVSVRRNYEDSSMARILDLVENAASRKAKTEKFISVFARYYTPAVVIAAAAVAFVPPLIVPGATIADWAYRALVLLVISCPCALVISIPLGYFGGIGAASRRGILIKGANYLEALAKVKTLVLDKTGTVTEGVFHVSDVLPENGFTADELIRFGAEAESGSQHPVAQAVVEAYSGSLVDIPLERYEEMPGYGVKALVRGRQVCAGNDRMLHREEIPHENCISDSTVVYVAVDGVLAGSIKVADRIKDDAKGAVDAMRSLGVDSITMLTGDEDSVAARVASEIGVDSYHANLLPEDKVAKVEALLAATEGRGGGKLLFVGDGINDAPVISRADIGVAMGGLGSDAAVEAADVVIMDDKPSKLVVAISVARRTRAIVMQNVALALGIKAVFVVLGIAGTATMWQAVIADVGVALLAVLNATRVLASRNR